MFWHFLELVAAAVLGSGCTVWFLKTRQNPVSATSVMQGTAEAKSFDANLDEQLERAKTIPGAEAVLNTFMNKTGITQSDLNKMAQQFTELERLARVNDVRRGLMLERFAPITQKYAKEAIANLNDARRARSQNSGN